MLISKTQLFSFFNRNSLQFHVQQFAILSKYKLFLLKATSCSLAIVRNDVYNFSSLLPKMSVHNHIRGYTQSANCGNGYSYNKKEILHRKLGY